MQKFWIVACNKSDLMAQRRHPTLEAAQQEATRLAQKHIGNVFLVFELVGSVAPYNPPVIWELAKPHDADTRMRMAALEELSKVMTEGAGETRVPFEEAE